LHFYDAKIATYSQKGQQQKVVSKCDKYMCVYKKKRGTNKKAKRKMQIDMCVYGAAKKRKSTENGNFYFCFFCQNVETKIGGK